MEAPLFPYAAPIIPRAPFNSNNGINGRLMKSKGRRPKRKTFKKEMKYLAHVPKIIRRQIVINTNTQKAQYIG